MVLLPSKESVPKANRAFHYKQKPTLFCATRLKEIVHKVPFTLFSLSLLSVF